LPASKRSARHQLSVAYSSSYYSIADCRPQLQATGRRSQASDSSKQFVVSSLQ
jgi:hypothetical protein